MRTCFLGFAYFLFVLVLNEMASAKRVRLTKLPHSTKPSSHIVTVSQSDVFQTEVPFTDGKKLGDVINLRDAFDAKVLDKARESETNTLGAVADPGRETNIDVRTAAFKTVQELATRLGNRIGYMADLNLDTDPVTKQPGLLFEIDFNHIASLPDTSLNFDVDLGELAKFGIERSNLGVSAQIDAQFDFIVMLKAPGSEDANKIADVQPDGAIAFRTTKLISSLNGVADLMSAAGNDLKVTLADGSIFSVDLDRPIVPVTSNVKANVNDDLVTGDLTSKITFSGSPNLTGVANGMILSLINRTDGAQRTDRFTITGIDNVFLRNLQIDAAANLNATVGKATASLGIVGLNFTDGMGVANIGGGLAIHDPGPVFDGRITLKEASNAILDLATKLTAQQSIVFPVTPPVGALNLLIRGKDTDLKIPAGNAVSAADLAAKLNADLTFKTLATATGLAQQTCPAARHRLRHAGVRESAATQSGLVKH